MDPNNYHHFHYVSDLELNRLSLEFQWHNQDPKQRAEDEAYMEYLCSELDKGEEA